MGQNSELLIKVPGIGKKTADRLILELKDKFTNDQITQNINQFPTEITDIQNALLALGYNQKDIVNVTKDFEEDITVNNGIRQALKILSKNL